MAGCGAAGEQMIQIREIELYIGANSHTQMSLFFLSLTGSTIHMCVVIYFISSLFPTLKLTGQKQVSIKSSCCTYYERILLCDNI
jgi:hypothetical protein